MIRGVATAAGLVLLTACGTGIGDEDGSQTGAWVMCEEFLDDRIGPIDEFGGHGDTEISGANPYVVTSRYSDGGPWISYTCEIEKTSADEWTLVNLTVDR